MSPRLSGARSSQFMKHLERRSRLSPKWTCGQSRNRYRHRSRTTFQPRPQRRRPRGHRHLRPERERRRRVPHLVDQPHVLLLRDQLQGGAQSRVGLPLGREPLTLHELFLSGHTVS
jgi:hypothetical protein